MSWQDLCNRMNRCASALDELLDQPWEFPPPTQHLVLWTEANELFHEGRKLITEFKQNRDVWSLRDESLTLRTEARLVKVMSRFSRKLAAESRKKRI
jgi:hypothetical protein